jgi:cell division protein FtsW
MMIIKALRIGHAAMAQDKSYDAFLAYAIGVWFSFQTAINIGASSGILPTKGLTLPLVSYGGSSLIIMSVAVAILLRIDFELRVEGVQAIKKNVSKTGKRKSRTKKSEHTTADEIGRTAVDKSNE